MNTVKVERIKQVKRVPELRLAGFKDDWSSTRLGDLLSFKNGINANKEQYGRGVKFINVLDIINNNYITYDNIIGYVEVTEKEFEKNQVSYGDILFQRSSETREEVGQANVYLDNERSSVFGGFVIRGKKTADCNPVFMNYLLKTWLARKEITTKSGGSTRYNVGQDTLRDVVIYSTSPPEQKKIASFLSAVDKKIQQLTRKKELLEQYKKGVMQNLFSQEIRFKPALSEAEGDENGKDYPDWEEKRLGECAKFFSGGTPISSNKIFYDGDIPFIKSGEINKSKTEQFITEEALRSSSAKMVMVGDLLYALYGATAGEIGISKIEGAINQAVLCIRPQIQTTFVYYYYLMMKGRILEKYLQGGQGNLSANIVKHLTIPIPDIKEQEKIASYLSIIDNKIESVNNQITQTQQFKKGLLQQMFV